MKSPQDVSGEVIAKVYDNLQRIFTKEVVEQLYDDIPVPRVTLDLPGNEPEPLHVFVWGVARDFDAEQFLTGAHMSASFHVWITVLGTSSTSEEASRIANAYQALVMQMCLIDPTLCGLVEDAYSPVIKEAEAWADESGRRHAGYLLDLQYSVVISASDAVAQALKES